MKKALYILAEATRPLIYGPDEEAAIARMVEVIAPPQTAQSIAETPDLLAEVNLIFSGWGAPRLDADFLQAAPKLEAFFYGAGSVRRFVTEAFWERNIRLTSAYAANAIPVVEYTLSTILLSLKRFWYFALEGQRQGQYIHKSHDPSEMPGGYNSTVGIISLGMIGRLVCERLKTFDLKVLAYDPFVSQADAADLGVTMVSLDEIFAQADVVSLHTPWLPETVGMIRGEHIAAMKPQATFINTARGAVVHEAEMIAALQNRPDLYAVLDVVYPEPPAPDSPLLTMPNVVLTPHIAGSIGLECRRMGQYVVDDLTNYLTGQPLNWEITREQAAIMA